MTVSTKVRYKARGGVWKLPADTASTSFAIGVTQPTAATTGVPVGTTLTTHAGDLIVTTDGTIIDSQLVRGIIDIRANNCIVQNCKVVGRQFSAYPGWDAMIRSSGTGNVIQFNECTMYDDTLSQDNWIGPGGYSAYYMVGIKVIGGTATVHRNHVHDTDHLIELSAGTHTVTGNFAHAPSFRTDDADHASDATHPNWSHNDGLHISGGTNHLVQGNSFDMAFSTLTGMNSVANPNPDGEQWWPNAHGMLLRSNANPVTGVQIKQNWFKRGAVGPHFTTSTYTGGTATLDQNRFTPDQSKEFSEYAQIRIDTTAWTATDAGTNVYSTDLDTPTVWQGQPLKAATVGSGTKVWYFNRTVHTP